MPTGNLAYDQAVEQITAARDAAYASWQAPAAAPAWASGITYGVGAFASSGGVVYKSLAAGNVGNAPASSPSHWQAMTFANQQAGVRAADIQYHQSIIAVAPTYGFVPLASLAALQGLGLSPVPPT